MKTNLLLTAQVGFIALTSVFFFLLIKEIKNAVDNAVFDHDAKRKFMLRFVIGLFVWGLFVSIWSLSGIMSDFTRFPLNFMPVLVIPLVSAIVLLFSKSLSAILEDIPVANLIRLQSFRFFVELLLWALFVANVLPVQMTFEGRNFDILVGLSAPFISWLAAHQKISRTAIIIWNIAGLALLVNIVTIAILSTPSPVRVFMNEPANTIVAYFPISWLPGFLVPLAYTLHLLSLKQLLTKPLPTAVTR